MNAATTGPTTPTIAGITHHHAKVNGSDLHYVAAGKSGSPILLVHGFPETARIFSKRAFVEWSILRDLPL
jgi:hypothetical protein